MKYLNNGFSIFLFFLLVSCNYSSELALTLTEKSTNLSACMPQRNCLREIGPEKEAFCSLENN